MHLRISPTKELCNLFSWDRNLEIIDRKVATQMNSDAFMELSGMSYPHYFLYPWTNTMEQALRCFCSWNILHPYCLGITLEICVSGITHLKLLIHLREHSVTDHSPIFILIVKLEQVFLNFPGWPWTPSETQEPLTFNFPASDSLVTRITSIYHHTRLGNFNLTLITWLPQIPFEDLMHLLSKAPKGITPSCLIEWFRYWLELAVAQNRPPTFFV